MPGMSTSSIMPFHNHVAKLVHWFFWCFSRSTNLGSRTHFCRVSQHSLEFDYPLPFKEYSTVLYSTAVEYCTIVPRKVVSVRTSWSVVSSYIQLWRFKEALLVKTKNHLPQVFGSPDSSVKQKWIVAAKEKTREKSVCWPKVAHSRKKTPCCHWDQTWW